MDFTHSTSQITSNCAFFALPGKKHDNSYAHAKEAIELGAKTIIAWKTTCQALQVHYPHITYIPSNNPRYDYALACKKAFYKHKIKKLCAVTGSKGKTSIAYFIKQLLPSAGYIGTLGIYDRQKQLPCVNQTLTSPDPRELYQYLEQLSHNDCVAFEYSSIGLDAQRSIETVDLGIISNFTGDDHLIYHGTVENYKACKLLLSHYAKRLLVWSGDEIAQEVDCIKYGQESDLYYIDAKPVKEGFQADIYVKQKLQKQTFINLLGDFQILNLCAALGACLEMNYDLDDLDFSNLQVPGRMEKVCEIGNNSVIVDFAHTPASLKLALQSLKKHYQKIILIFGCGGQRDSIKRTEMGKVAYEHADYTIITDDNPRNENPADIRSQILQACPSAKDIGNRKQAIQAGLSMLDDQTNCALLIAGKGHESYQIIGDKVMDFNDRDCVEKLIINCK